MTDTPYSDELDEILMKLARNTTLADRAAGVASTVSTLKDASKIFDWSISEAKQALTSLIKELVIPARSGREYDLADPTGSPLGERVDNRRFKSGGTMDYIDGLNSGYNRAINEFEQNLLKALEEN